MTESQIETYYREGYLVAQGLVLDSRLDSVTQEARKVQPAPGGKWTPRIFDHAHPAADAALHQLLCDDRVVGAVEQIFENPARVYYGMLAVVPARGGIGLPWHQDNQYSHILGRALNVFIALADIGPDQAILWVAPKTHLGGVQLAKSRDDGHREAVVEPANGFALPGLKKGDAVIFDRSTYHRSLKNETDVNRYAYAAQYHDDAAREAETGKKDPLRMRARNLATMMSR